jgi:predicted Zn finger-like uncharacterized protein
MIIRCPSCGSTYDISKQPQAAGRKVKCMRCSHVWKADPVDIAPAVAKSATSPVVPPPAAASEIAVARPPVAARAPESFSTALANGAAGYQNGTSEAAPAPRVGNGFNGLANAPEDADFGASDRLAAPPPPLTTAARRPADFEANLGPARRPVAASPPDAGYYEEEAPPPRQARRPEPQWREPPQASYRDEAYGDYDQGYAQDDFSPRQGGRPVREPRVSRGRRAAAIVGWVAYLAALGSLGAYAYAGRDQIVAWLPGAAPYYAEFGLPVNRYGLQFRDVQATWGKATAGQAELAVSVGVENVTSKAVKVPTVVIAFKDADGDELFYRAMADALPSTLQAGKSAKFSATLQVPTDATRAIQVRFATGL